MLPSNAIISGLAAAAIAIAITVLVERLGGQNGLLTVYKGGQYRSIEEETEAETRTSRWN